jgi:hypothetical protein
LLPAASKLFFGLAGSIEHLNKAENVFFGLRESILFFLYASEGLKDLFESV